MGSYVSLSPGASQLNAKTAFNAELSKQEPKKTASPIQALLRAALAKEDGGKLASKRPSLRARHLRWAYNRGQEKDHGEDRSLRGFRGFCFVFVYCLSIFAFLFMTCS